MSGDPTVGKLGGPRVLCTLGSARSPHKAGVRRQLHALQPELRFFCCCKNKVLRKRGGGGGGGRQKKTKLAQKRAVPVPRPD